MDQEDKSDRTVHILREIPFFDDFSYEEMALFSKNLSLRYFEASTILFNKGDIGDYLFFVVEGKVEIRLDRADVKNIIVATFTHGSCVGEMAVIDDYPRSAAIAVVEPSELLLLSKHRFEILCRDNPVIALKFIRGIAKNLSARLRKTTGRFADLT